jgi:DNA-binding transcriptional regulator YiaG
MSKPNLTQQVLDKHQLDQGSLSERLGCRRETVNTWARGRFQPSNRMKRKLDVMLAEPAKKASKSASKPKKARK